MDAEAVCKRCVDLERLARLLHLLLLAEVLDRAQVVHAVGEFDQDHADVLGHRDDQLPVVLRLRVLAALELNARQLGDALDQGRDLVAELRANLVDIGVRVLDDVVQQRSRERRLVQLQPGEDLRRPPRMVDELLSRGARLPRVRMRGEVECPGEQLAVGVRLVGLDLGDQLLDKILMPLEYRHEPSVPPAFGASSSVSAYRFGRIRRCVAEPSRSMFRRRRQTKKLLRVARMLRELDGASASRRPLSPERRVGVRVA